MHLFWKAARTEGAGSIVVGMKTNKLIAVAASPIKDRLVRCERLWVD